MDNSGQACLLCNKPFDYLKIVVFDFTYLLSFKPPNMYQKD